jgi:uncharacterized membrane protein
MNRWLYWGSATLLIALVVHLGYVLFAPAPKLDQIMTSFRDVVGVNRFKVLTREETDRLLPLEGPALVHAVCAFDITDRPARAELPIPSDYWSLSVITEDGRNAYLLNDRQAGVPALSLVLRRKAEEQRPAVAGGDTAEAEEAAAAIDPQSTANRIYIDLAQPRGIVVLRALPRFPAERAEVEAELARSACNQG